MAINHEFTAGIFDPIPFVIQWAADSVHPSQDSPSGCALQSLTIEAPKATALSDELRRLWIDAAVKEAQAPRLVATLKTPKGSVTLT